VRDLDRLLCKALTFSHEPDELDELGLALVRSAEHKRLGIEAKLECRVEAPLDVPEWVKGGSEEGGGNLR
jgi:hypothetical protein